MQSLLAGIFFRAILGCVHQIRHHANLSAGNFILNGNDLGFPVYHYPQEELNWYLLGGRHKREDRDVLGNWKRAIWLEIITSRQKWIKDWLLLTFGMIWWVFGHFNLIFFAELLHPPKKRKTSRLVRFNTTSRGPFSRTCMKLKPVKRQRATPMMPLRNVGPGPRLLARLMSLNRSKSHSHPNHLGMVRLKTC